MISVLIYSPMSLIKIHVGYYSFVILHMSQVCMDLLKFTSCRCRLIQGSHTSWKTWQITKSFSRPGNVLEFSKIWNCPGQNIAWYKNSLRTKKHHVNKYYTCRRNSLDISC